MNVQARTTLDFKGLSCPLPIVKTALALKSMQPGDVVEVLATDPGSVSDFQAWARSTGHRLVEMDSSGDVFRFVIEKKR